MEEGEKKPANAGPGILKAKSSAQEKGKKPIAKYLGPILTLFIVIYVLAVPYIILADGKIAWLPWDVVGSIASDIHYMGANHAEKAQDVLSSSSSNFQVGSFVEKQFIPALKLIDRDPEFKYLADMVVKYKIPIVVNNDIPGNSEYLDHCPGNPVGKLSVKSSFAGSRTDILAGVLVHELTHAYNRIVANPSYYCTSTHHISDEMDARNNHYRFWYEYDHFLFFGPYTTGMIDLRGNIQEYCLYAQIKKSDPYSTWPDDANLSPQGDEGKACSFSSFI